MHITLASGINDSGTVIGTYFTNFDYGIHGYTYNSGTFTTIDVPSALFTRANGVNSFGATVGSYNTAPGVAHGFLDVSGTITTLDDPLAGTWQPGYTGTTATGINASGEIVGYYYDPIGVHGFSYVGGAYTTLDDPLASTNSGGSGPGGTAAEGINDLGWIVGYYDDASGRNHGFLCKSGVFTTFDDPAASAGEAGTVPAGINTASVIVGSYDGNHGFVATSVPEPASWALLIAGFGMMGVTLRCRAVVNA